MNWKRKAQIQNVLSHLPGGVEVYYWLQKNVTKSLPPPESKLIEYFEMEVEHVETCREHLDVPLSEATFFQFGAGWTMGSPLTFYSFGVKKQILVDIRRLIRPELINCSIQFLQKMAETAPFTNKLDQIVSKDKNRAVEQLREWWGIDYRAPADARSTGLPDNSVDAITSTNTLEHIPKQDIANILTECRRILKPGGVLSFQVDYQDHYSYFDRNVSLFHYLQFSESEWKRYNPSLHYQNRLRHCDYIKLYQQAGFDTICDRPQELREEDVQCVSSMTVDSRYADYSVEELATRTSRTVLTKPAIAASNSPQRQRVA